MNGFMDCDFLLTGPTARRLYHDIAAPLPIIDYHCHINPAEIRDNRRFSNITEVWLGGDHYKWRVMRACGVPEALITGGGDPREAFRAWAAALPRMPGNPLYHWAHLELQRYFGIDEPLNAGNADAVYDHCNAVLAQPDMDVRGIIARSKVELICTTDDPADTLEAHAALREKPLDGTRVLPAFRPDRAMNLHRSEFSQYIQTLSASAGLSIDSLDSLKRALSQRMDHFHDLGCRVSDHGLDTAFYTEAPESALNAIFQFALNGQAPGAADKDAYQTHMLLWLAAEYAKRGWVMQLHMGCLRNNSGRWFERLGPDAGYDCIHHATDPRKLAALLDAMERGGALPKTVLYSLNPNDSEMMATVMGCFMTDAGMAGKLQLGSAWWFNDHLGGMEKQMKDLASVGVLGCFIGMLTDSRSFLSYTRHEYFRRILCNLLGGWVDGGLFPNDEALLHELVRDISHDNAKRYFML